MANVYGYARVSTEEQQTLSIQEEALRKAGAGIVIAEKKSGTQASNRPKLQTLLDMLQRGDTLMATRLDRIGRSVRDLAAIVGDLTDRGVAIKCTEQPFDTSTSIGRAMVGMLSVFAQFENDIRRERQMEGIRRAQREGKYAGRPRSIDGEKVAQLRAKGVSPTEIGQKLKISRASVYRVLDEAKRPFDGAAA
jgi:DNA invertase Pin-like site-specific DNA recombinase